MGERDSLLSFLGVCGRGQAGWWEEGGWLRGGKDTTRLS